MMLASDSEAVEHLVNAAIALVDTAPGRILIALSGPPASGKSTLAAALVKRLNTIGQSAILVPMDGFHLDNRVLQRRCLLDRKGAPETFDATGFVNAIKRLKAEGEVVLPEFDRTKDISVAGAIIIEASHRIVVVEGNYLCFDEAPWQGLQSFWDISAYLDVPQDVLAARLTQRWLDHGLPLAAARQKVADNDLPNSDRIARARSQCDLTLRIRDDSWCAGLKGLPAPHLRFSKNAG